MDSPTELSEYTLRSFKVPQSRRQGVHHSHAPCTTTVIPRQIDGYASGAEKIVNEAAAIFGEFPAFDTGTYTFLGDYVPWGGGDGMEHRNSTVVASATSFKNPQAVRRALGTVVARVLPLLGMLSASVRRHSSRSTSKRPTFPASCG